MKVVVFEKCVIFLNGRGVRIDQRGGVVRVGPVRSLYIGSLGRSASVGGLLLEGLVYSSPMLDWIPWYIISFLLLPRTSAERGICTIFQNIFK